MLTAKLVGHNKPGSDYPRDCLICIQPRCSAQDDDDDVLARVEPSRVESFLFPRRVATRLRSTRGFHACHQVPRIFQTDGCEELALNVDGTATTIGALVRSPIPSRIASYFRFVIRLTNQRTIYRAGIRSDFRERYPEL